ncbi:class II fructose-1,6-bisphosphate aldolase [Candidatus Peregrinibacteria bacterium]|nr:class II fructose-1,6-bisphosphate aldolase [Candidatus Peregrinibacteria bacterium]
MLVDSKKMFEDAYKGGYAIGAFNVNNMEIIQGIIGGCAEKKSPVIIQVSAGARKYANPIYLRKLIEAAVEEHPEVPICMHLDHGADFDICKQCVDMGFTSVMIDGSHYDFEENIRVTKEVVDYAHSKGVVVEAELGKLEGVEDEVKVASGEGSYTDPDQAVEFVERTGCDSLAISIGTSHGAFKFKGDPKLDFERLDIITKKLSGFPLVLHGASTVIQEFVDKCNQYGGDIPGAKGVPEEMISQAVKSGVCKVNIDTDLRLAMTAEIRKAFHDNPGNFDPRGYLKPARTAIQEMVMHKLDILGNINRI